MLSCDKKNAPIDIFLSYSNDCDFIFDICGENILSYKLLSSGFSISTGVQCDVFVYTPKTTEANFGAGVGSSIRVSIEKRKTINAGVGVGNTTNISRIISIPLSAGIGNGAIVRVGGEIWVKVHDIGVGANGTSIVRAYKWARVKDYDGYNVQHLYSKGGLKDIYLIEK